ncbi:hypothetical protein THAOC_12884, partial [Thalassiosira oceanica]
QEESSTMTRQITLDLLRKRSEHNEGLVSSLEELALHQVGQCRGCFDVPSSHPLTATTKSRHTEQCDRADGSFTPQAVQEPRVCKPCAEQHLEDSNAKGWNGMAPQAGLDAEFHRPGFVGGKH